MQPSDSAETFRAALPLPSVRFLVKIADPPFLGKTSATLPAFERVAEIVLPVTKAPAPASSVDFKIYLFFIVDFILFEAYSGHVWNE
jgi:hypothetical protein